MPTGEIDLTENVPVDAPGVSDDEIRVGSITSITNPLGGNYGDMNEGIKGYFDLVNSQGGIYGRQLVLTSTRDDQLGNNQTEAEALGNLKEALELYFEPPQATRPPQVRLIEVEVGAA